MKYILFIGICLILWFSPVIRCIVFNFFSWLSLSFKDFILFLKNKSFNTCPCGTIRCFSGLFGHGKTLSAVHHLKSLYKRYNGKRVFYKGSFRTNKVIVVSNVDFKDIPFIPLTSLSQIVGLAECLDKFEGDDYCVTFLILIDEASSQLNSRDFKTNINALFLNTLLTSRHYRMSLFYTSQRFLLVDKLLREVTTDVVECHKIGRVQKLSYYSAFDLENSSNITLVKPKFKNAFLVRDSDYSAYDTLACVANLQKAFREGKLITTEEILNNIDNTDNLDNVNSLSRAGKKLFKRKQKKR